MVWIEDLKIDSRRQTISKKTESKTYCGRLTPPRHLRSWPLLHLLSILDFELGPSSTPPAPPASHHTKVIKVESWGFSSRVQGYQGHRRRGFACTLLRIFFYRRWFCSLPDRLIVARLGRVSRWVSQPSLLMCMIPVLELENVILSGDSDSSMSFTDTPTRW